MHNHLQTQIARGVAPNNVAASTGRPTLKPFGDDGLTFGDVLDVVNPLQHIPVLGNLYRRATGDSIDPATRIAGGALFGGPFGAAFAAAAVVIRHLASASPTPAPPLKEAASAAPQPARGGWIVAATRPAATFASARAADTASRPQPAAVLEGDLRGALQPRRGGWMVVQAYAMADARRPGPDFGRARLHVAV